MKIIRLEAENVKRIEAVTIEPSGAVVEIAGDNGQGKTSVLDAIAWAIGGERLIQSKPVKRGRAQAHVTLDLGDGSPALRVTRIFKPDGTSTLKVQDGDGGRVREPQSVLNALLGKLTLDPVAFQRMKPAERIGVLKSLVPDFDFEAAAAERQRTYDKRTERSRDVKRLKAQWEGTPPPPPGTPDEEIDTAALMRAISEGIDAHMEFERRNMERQNQIGRAAMLDRQADMKEAEARDARNEAKSIRAAIAEAGEIEPPANTSEAQEILANANETNAAVRAKKARVDLVKQSSAAELDVEKLTKDIAAIDDRIRQAVATADIPVRGLALGEEDVMLNGVPFDQASDAEQLRASLALAMAEQPGLRVIRIRDGSLLDNAGFKVIEEVAAEDGWQIWIESVQPHSAGAYLMIEGRVKE